MFKTNFSMKSFTGILGSTLIALMFVTSTDAVAQTESVVVQVAFVAPVILDPETNALEYGSLDDAMAVGEQVIVDPDNSVTDAGANVVGSPPLSAKLNVTTTPSRPINILVDTIAPGSHYTLGTFLCDYNGPGESGPCEGPGGLSIPSSNAGPTEIRIGATLTALATVTAGNFNGTFNVTVTYE